jgi:hypothetical protein
MTIYFEEEDADDKARAFVPVDERVIAYDAGCVGGGNIDEAGLIAIGAELSRPGESGLQQVGIAHACGTAVQGEKTVMLDIAGVDAASSCASICQPRRLESVYTGQGG